MSAPTITPLVARVRARYRRVVPIADMQSTDTWWAVWRGDDGHYERRAFPDPREANAFLTAEDHADAWLEQELASDLF